MRRFSLVGFIILVVLALRVITKQKLLQQLYPQAPAMPALVTTPVEELLLQYEMFLKEKIPAALAAQELQLKYGAMPTR